MAATATAAISLLVGLGNPGPQYEQTRHNVGFWLVQKFAYLHNVEFKLETKFKGLIASIILESTIKGFCFNHEIKLLMPQTYMNLSGQSVVALAHFYKITPEQILVVHDELDFIPGVLRFKKGGGANGHNGVQNIINLIGSNNFYRLRIGVGKPENHNNIADYVLNRPSLSEQERILNGIGKALKVLTAFIFGNIDQATEELHKWVSNAE